MTNRKWCKTYYDKKKDLIEDKLGNYCYFCLSREKARIHNKEGIRHRELASMNFKDLYKALETDDYVILCARCHGCVHWCMKFLRLKWSQIVRLNIL